MFEKYSTTKVAVKNLTKKQQNKLIKDIFAVACEISENMFDFSMPLDDDVTECISLMNESEPDLSSAVKKIAIPDVFGFSCGTDFEQNPYYNLSTFRNTGEQLDLSFDYYAELNRLEMMLTVKFSGQGENIQYYECYLRNKNDVIFSFIKNSLIIFQKVDSIISEYHNT